jgi:hypothetical protein
MNFKANKLFNMAIPLFFIEWWFVMIAFIFIALIESFIVNFFIKKGYRKLFKILLIANLLTTLLGYLLQGIARTIITIILWVIGLKYESFGNLLENPIIEGIIGGVTPQKGGGTPDFTLDVIFAIATSILITFTLSVVIERKILIKHLGSEFERSLITKSILIANIVSYTLLTIWIFYGYSTMSF